MELNKYFDHTLLKADARKEAVIKLCKEAKEYGFASVCVNPDFVALCAEELKGTDVKVCTVVGFPLGSMISEAKAFEAAKAIEQGAKEVDMVINISALKDGDLDYVTKDIRTVKEACGSTLLKVIIETCLLTNEEKIQACECALKAGADYVKTSTGFSKAGATPEDVKLMKDTVGNNAKVKAAGGIHTLAEANAMIAAGADRLGCSASVAIMEEYQKAQ
ncbi:MAG: deoxyribose-phosphate aldolase [Erysipelotrichaceae bacterium]|nr:deoxyribose-phosphate aldolase [Erysipelotrichaceae bacterium]MBQ5755934.1 deoxyribose-phosphate aldolase [Erysipelotrichaceae bacterium]